MAPQQVDGIRLTRDNFDVSSAPLISCVSRGRGLLGRFMVSLTYSTDVPTIPPYIWVKIAIGEEVYEVAAATAQTIYTIIGRAMVIQVNKTNLVVSLPTPDVLMVTTDPIEPFWVNTLLRVQMMLPVGAHNVSKASLVYNKYMPMGLTIPQSIGHVEHCTVIQFSGEVGLSVATIIDIPLSTLPRGVLVAVLLAKNSKLLTMAEVRANGKLIGTKTAAIVCSGGQPKILVGLNTEQQVTLSVKFDLTDLTHPTTATVACVVYQYTQ